MDVILSSRAQILAKNSRCPILRASSHERLFLVLLSTQKNNVTTNVLSFALFGMKGRESDLLTHVLHVYII